MRHVLKQLTGVILLLLPVVASTAPVTGNPGISLIPSVLEAPKQIELISGSASALSGEFAEEHTELDSGVIENPETGSLRNYLPPTLSRASSALLLDRRLSNPLFVTDSTMAADLSRVFKTPFGYYNDKKVAEAEKAGKFTDDGAAVFLGVAGVLLFAGAFFYGKAVRNKEKIRKLIHELRHRNGVRRRRSSRRSRTVMRR